ncbi:MAG: isoprenylcysteine carboxylmethyltransferase family protein [Rhodomicrobium sp.]
MSGQDHGTPEPVNERILPIPPVVAGLFIASGWLLNHFVPLQDRSGPAATESRIAGAAVVACAFAIAGLALLQMRRSRTTFHPGGRANALVQGGVFQRSRNPMYLSLTLLTLGLGILSADLWMSLLAPLLLLYLQERVVKREEAYLTQRFGAEYAAYRSKVRRWF